MSSGRGFRSEEDPGRSCGVDRRVVVGVVFRGIPLLQPGGTPGAHAGWDPRRPGGVRASYKRVTVTQVSLATAGFLSALVAWRSSSDARWLLGGGLLVSVVPFTALAILPTNKKLLDPETANDLDLAEGLLTRWGRLHAARSVLSLASLLTFLFLLGERRRG